MQRNVKIRGEELRSECLTKRLRHLIIICPDMRHIQARSDCSYLMFYEVAYDLQISHTVFQQEPYFLGEGPVESKLNGT